MRDLIVSLSRSVDATLSATHANMHRFDLGEWEQSVSSSPPENAESAEIKRQIRADESGSRFGLDNSGVRVLH